MRKIASIIVGFACLSALTGTVRAAAITVPNFSFESQSGVGQPSGVNINVDNWQKAPEPGYWAAVQAESGYFWVQTAGVFLDTFPNNANPYGNHDGSQAAYMLPFPGVSLFQDLTAPDAKFTAGMSYNLTVGLYGKNMSSTANTLELSLYYRDGGNNMVTVGTPTTITYSTGSFPSAPPFNFVDYTVNLGEVQPDDAWAGQFMGINIRAVNSDFQGGSWDLDNVRLTATPVPEPGTLSLMALGLGGLALTRIRSGWTVRRLAD